MTTQFTVVRKAPYSYLICFLNGAEQSLFPKWF